MDGSQGNVLPIIVAILLVAAVAGRFLIAEKRSRGIKSEANTSNVNRTDIRKYAVIVLVDIN